MRGRPPALTPAQQEEVRRRLAAGEGVRALAAEFKVGKATIGRLAGHAGQVRKVAETLAAAQTALEALPLAQQHTAVALAEKLRNISHSLASAAELGARTAHRLHALANTEVAKVDDADPIASVDKLRNVGVLTKLANDSANIAVNLLSANKDRVRGLDEPEEPPAIDPTKLSPQALEELLAARDAPALAR